MFIVGSGDGYELFALVVQLEAFANKIEAFFRQSIGIKAVKHRKFSSKPANWTFQMGDLMGIWSSLAHEKDLLLLASPKFLSSNLNLNVSGVKGGCIGYISILSWSNKMSGFWNHNKKMRVYHLHSWFCYWNSFCVGHISHIPISFCWLHPQPFFWICYIMLYTFAM